MIDVMDSCDRFEFFRLFTVRPCAPQQLVRCGDAVYNPHKYVKMVKQQVVFAMEGYIFLHRSSVMSQDSECVTAVLFIQSLCRSTDICSITLVIATHLQPVIIALVYFTIENLPV